MPFSSNTSLLPHVRAEAGDRESVELMTALS